MSGGRGREDLSKGGQVKKNENLKEEPTSRTSVTYIGSSGRYEQTSRRAVLASVRVKGRFLRRKNEKKTRQIPALADSSDPFGKGSRTKQGIRENAGEEGADAPLNVKSSV